jgi:hypothetical protein
MVSIGHEPGSGPTLVDGAPLLDPLVLPELLPPLPLELLLLDPLPLPLELLLLPPLPEPPLPLPLPEPLLLPPLLELPLPPLDPLLDPPLQSAEPDGHQVLDPGLPHAEARALAARSPPGRSRAA